MRGSPRLVRPGAGLRVFLFSALLYLCSAENTTCGDVLLHVLPNSCAAATNSAPYRDAVLQYLDCKEAHNVTQVPELDLLLSSTVQLPDAVLERFQKETGWMVRVDPWDANSVAAGSGSWLADWRERLLLSYDAWILDSELLAGFALCKALAQPAPLLDSATFIEIQAAAQPQVRRYGISYRYLTAGLPVGSNTLALYANGAALKRLYSDDVMRQRLGMRSATTVSTGSSESSRQSDNGSNSSSSSSKDSSNSSSLQSEEDLSLQLQLPPVWSWEQLVDAVAAVNGTDFDDDGVAEFGICLEVSSGCLGPALLQAIAASYLQTHGPNDGVLIDPVTMAWRLDSAGFRSALWTLQRLLSYSAPPLSSSSSSSPSCRRLSAGFAEGRCAFTVQSLTHLKAAYTWPGRKEDVVSGTRVMMLPGSNWIDRDLDGVMDECTASLCPYALPLHDAEPTGGMSSVRALLSSSLSWRGSGGSGGSGDAPTRGVNVAPLVYGNPVGGINAGTSAASRAAAARLLALLASADVQQVLASDLESGVWPFRSLRASTNSTATTASLSAVSTASLAQQRHQQSPPMVLSNKQQADIAYLEEKLWGHPNAAPALRLPGVETLWPHIDAAVAQLSPYTSPLSPLTLPANMPLADDIPPQPPTVAVMAAQELLRRELPAALEAAMPAAAQRQAEYRASLSYRPSVLVQQRSWSPPPRPASKSRVALIVGLAVGLGSGALLLAALFMLRSRRTLRRFRGTSSSGGDSSSRRNTATYVVLDIQGLSEPGISEAAREQALRMCQDVIKQLARRYNGSFVSLPDEDLPTHPVIAAAQRSGGGCAVDRIPGLQGAAAAALQAALAAELTASVADRALAVGSCSGGVGGSVGYDYVGESGGGNRLRPPYWVYESSYLSMTSRDLDAPPQPRQSVDIPQTFDGPLAAVTSGYGMAGAATPTASIPTKTSPSHERIASHQGVPIASIPAYGGTPMMMDCSGHLSTPGSVRVAAAPNGAVCPTVQSYHMPQSRADSPVPYEGGTAASADSTAPPPAPSGSATVSSPPGGFPRPPLPFRSSGGTASARSLRIAAETTALSMESTPDCAQSSVPSGANCMAAATVIAPHHATHLVSAESGSGGCAGAHLLRMVRQTAPSVTPHQRSSMQLQHAATTHSTFLGQTHPSSCKESLSAGHLSDMLLPLPAAALSPGTGGGIHGGGTCSLSPLLEQQLLQSPFAMYRSCSSEIPRPSYDSDFPPGALGLHSSGVGPAAPVLPTLPEGVPDSGTGAESAAEVSAAAAGAGPGSHPGSRRGFGAGMPHAYSTPSTPLFWRQNGLSPPRLRPAPYMPLVGAFGSTSPTPSALAAAMGSSSHPHASRGASAWAAAMAAAKVAAGAAAMPARPPRTRLALIFSSVHDAVCFCVHMQAMLTNCRWPPEVLELPGCQPVAVRPRALGADDPTAAGGAGGDGAIHGPASGTADFTVHGIGGGSGASAAGGGRVLGAESGGGVVMASAQSSFLGSNVPSPFSPSGAVDRMKSLISGGVKGRSGRALRQVSISPRIATHGLAAGASISGGLMAPERSALSVSRFATASVGPSSMGGAVGHFTTRSLMPHATINGGGANAGFDPWVVGTASSVGACSRSDSTTAWAPPQFSGSFGNGGGGCPTGALAGSTAAAPIVLQSGGGPNSASHMPPRSPLGRSSRGGIGSTAHASSFGWQAPAGSASLPLPKLFAVPSSQTPPAQASMRSVAAGHPLPLHFPRSHQLAVRRAGGSAADGTASAVISGGSGGGGGAPSSYQFDCYGGGDSNVPTGDGVSAAGAPATAGAAVLPSGDSGMPVRLINYSDRDTMDMVIGSFDSETDVEAVKINPVAEVVSGYYGTDSVTANGTGNNPGAIPDSAKTSLAGGFFYGPEVLDDGSGQATAGMILSPPPPPPLDDLQALRSSNQTITMATLPVVSLHSMPSHNVQHAATGSSAHISRAHVMMQFTSSVALDSFSPVGSAATLVVGGFDRGHSALTAPTSLQLPPADTEPPAPVLVSLGGALAAGSVFHIDNAGGFHDAVANGGYMPEFSLGTAGELRGEPTLEMPTMSFYPPSPPPPAGAALADIVEASPSETWSRPSHRPIGRPVAEAMEDLNNSITTTLSLKTDTVSGDISDSRTNVSGHLTAAAAAGAAALLAGGPTLAVARASQGSCCGGGGAAGGSAASGGAWFTDRTSALQQEGERALGAHPQHSTSNAQLPAHGLMSSDIDGEGVGILNGPTGTGATPAHLYSRARGWTGGLLPPPPPSTPYDRMHASLPLAKVQLDEQEITTQFSAISTNLMRLTALRMSGVAHGALYVTAPDSCAGGVTVRNHPDSLEDGGGGDDMLRSRPSNMRSSTDPPRLGVRSFGEQVNMTFEPLYGVERNWPEEGVAVIFRGPRVVCGISTWQYGDEECTDMFEGRRSAIDGCSNDLQDNGLEQFDELGTVHVDAEPSLLPAAGSLSEAGDGLTSLPERTTINTGNPLAALLSVGRVSGGGIYSEGDVRVAAARNLRTVLSDDGRGGSSAAAAAAEMQDRQSYVARSNPLFHTIADGICRGLPYGGTESERLLDGAATVGITLDDEVTPQVLDPTVNTDIGTSEELRPVAEGSRKRAMSPEALKKWRRRSFPAPLRRALAICESGQGGFVLLDGATYSASSQEALQEQCMILHMGEYLLSGVTAPLDLYLALDFAHLARLAHLRHLSCAEQLSLGLPSAPVNAASICFSLVVGMQTLLAWNSEVAKAALGLLRDAALPALLNHGGYLVEDADGLLLTAFSSSRSALAWALECQDEAKRLDWPEELLGHALGEAVYVDDDLAQNSEDDEVGVGLSRRAGGQGTQLQSPGGTHDSNATAPTPRRHLVFRGLRIKSGLDCGDVLARVHATTGRMTYRGRVMNRAARIAGMATAGQVLCSRGLWDNSGLAVAPDLCQEALAVGESLGEVQLKGLSSKMEVINCIRILRSEMSPVAHEAMLDLQSLFPCIPGGQNPNDKIPHSALLETRVAARASEDSGPSGASDGIGAGAGESHTEDRSSVDKFPTGLIQTSLVLLDPDSGRMQKGVSAPIQAAPAEAAGVTAVNAIGITVRAEEPRLAGAETGPAPTASDKAKEGSLRGGRAAMPPKVSPGAAAAPTSELKSPGVRSMTTATAAGVSDPDGLSIARVSRASLTRASDAPRYAPAPKSTTPDMKSTPGTSGASASLAAALAAARIRRARELHNNRIVSSAVGIGTGTSMALAAVLQVDDDEDDMADRLVAGYSSDGSAGEIANCIGSGSDGNGEGPERPSVAVGGTAGVAALHGMLRRQLPTGGTGGGLQSSATGAALPMSSSPPGHGSMVSSAFAAAAAAAASGAAGSAAAKGHLATAAAANFKKALRAVKRSILDDPGAGGPSIVAASGSEGSASDSDGRFGGGTRQTPTLNYSATGVAGRAKLRRPPPRRRSELVRPSAAPVTNAAGHGGVRLFNRLRSLAVGSGGAGKGQGISALNEYDGVEEDEGEAGFQPKPSANSEFFPSRNGSAILSEMRSRFRAGGGNAPAGSSPLQMASRGESGTGEDGRSPAFSRTGRSGGSDGAAAGGGAFGRASSRLGGNSLVAELSLASMTMRRHNHVGQPVGSVAFGASGSARSLRGAGLAIDVAEVDGGTNGSGTSALAVTSPSGLPSSSSLSLPVSPLQQAKLPRRNRRTLTRISRAVGGCTDDVPYGIQEAVGEEEEARQDSGTQTISSGGGETAEATATLFSAASMRRSSETRPSAAATAAASGRGSQTLLNTAPSLPSRIASFTSSFIQRAISRKHVLQPALAPSGQTGSGEGSARPCSDNSELGEVPRSSGALTAGVSNPSQILGLGPHAVTETKEITGNSNYNSNSKPTGGGGGSGHVPFELHTKSTPSQAPGNVDSPCNGGTVSGGAMKMVASQQPTARLLLRIESLRRKSTLDLTSAAPPQAQVDTKGRRQSGSWSGHGHNSATAGRTMATTTSGSGQPSLSSGKMTLVRSATGAGFTTPAEAPRRHQSSGQQDPAAVASPPASDAGPYGNRFTSATPPKTIQGFPSRRSVFNSGSVSVAGGNSGGAGTYSRVGSGRTPVQLGAACAAGAVQTLGETHPVDPSAGGAAEGAAGGSGIGWGGLFSSLHNFLGLSNQGQAAAGAGGFNSPRASTALPSTAVLSCAVGGGGGTSVTGGRVGRRRSLLYNSVDEVPDGGGSGTDGSAPGSLRNQRRRSVIEVSGNVLILNAGASYATGGWPVALDSETLDYVGSSTMLGEPAIGGGGGSGAHAEVDAFCDRTYDFADLKDCTGCSGTLSPPPKAASAAAAATTTASAAVAAAIQGDQYGGPSSPRCRRSQRRMSILVGSSGGGSGGGNGVVKARRGN